MGQPVVLTSENAEAFYQHRMNPLPEPAAEAVVESAEVKSDAATAKAAQQEQPNPDKTDIPGKGDVRVRFSELTEQRKTAEAEAVKAKAEALVEREARVLAEKRAQELEAKHAPKTVATPAPDAAADEELGPEPKVEQFTDAFEYAKALAEYASDKAVCNALKERDDKAVRDRTFSERKKVEETFIERQTALIKDTPDYEKIIAASPVEVNNEVRDAIIESDAGPQILLHLAQNPDIGDAWKAMSLRSQLKEVGKLEAKLAPSKEAEPPKPAVAAQEISRAPAPINPLKGANAPVASPIDSNGVFHGTHAEWKAARKAGKIK